MNIFGNKKKKANDKDNAKIKLVEVSQLRFDRDFKNVFQQENDKVAEIANDMRVNGFDKSELNPKSWTLLEEKCKENSM